MNLPNQFRANFSRVLSHPINTLPYCLFLAIVVLPIVHGVTNLSWDEAVTAIAVPVLLVNVFAMVCLSEQSPQERARIEADLRNSKAESTSHPIPMDIGIAAVLLIGMLASLAIMVPSTLAYWLLHLPFAKAVAMWDWGVAKLMIYVVAYIGASLLWRWCLPLLKYESYSLIATISALAGGTHKRGAVLVPHR